MTEAIEAQVASLMARQGFREAAQLLERTLESCPTWTVGWLNLGLCRLRLRQGDPAALALEKGLELEPGRPRVRLSLADAAILRGRPDQAIDWCREECRQFPKAPPPGSPSAWHWSGSIVRRPARPTVKGFDCHPTILRLPPILDDGSTISTISTPRSPSWIRCTDIIPIRVDCSGSGP